METTHILLFGSYRRGNNYVVCNNVLFLNTIWHRILRVIAAGPVLVFCARPDSAAPGRSGVLFLTQKRPPEPVLVIVVIAYPLRRTVTLESGAPIKADRPPSFRQWNRDAPDHGRLFSAPKCRPSVLPLDMFCSRTLFRL